jgi:hypothetical protein
MNRGMWPFILSDAPEKRDWKRLPCDLAQEKIRLAGPQKNEKRNVRGLKAKNCV